LAELYQTKREYSKAEPLFQRALAIREKAPGPDHADLASSLNNLAVFYHYMAEYAKAEPHFQRALAIREKAPGPDHPDTASSLTIWRSFTAAWSLRQGRAALPARFGNP